MWAPIMGLLRPPGSGRLGLVRPSVHRFTGSVAMGSGSNACLEDDRPPAAITPAGEADIVLGSLAEFASEETLPARTSRSSHEDEALDAFDVEAPAFADPSPPTGTATTGATLAPDADGERRDLTPPAWRSLAAVTGVLGVIALGLLVKPPGYLPSPPDTARRPALATAATHSPSDEPAAITAAEAQPPAPPIEAPAESVRPLREDLAPQVERAVPGAATNGLAARATDEGFSPPSATTGNVMASNPSPTIDAGIGAVLPAAAPVPEIPPASVNALLVPVDAPAPLVSEPARLSAQDQVNAVLAQFQAGYSRLDAGSVQAIWPSVDRPRLERAFRNLEWQTLEFSECRLDVTGAAATAICTGMVEYGTRVGSQRAREARRWTFALREESAGWLIQNVLAR